METNKKPNELIFPLTVAHYSEHSEVQSIRNGNHVFSLMHDNQVDRIKIASAILTACNDYEALKKQNDELISFLQMHSARYDALSKITALTNEQDKMQQSINNLLTKYQK